MCGLLYKSEMLIKSYLKTLMCSLLNFDAELWANKHPNPNVYSRLYAKQNMGAVYRCKHCMLINNIHT